MNQKLLVLNQQLVPTRNTQILDQYKKLEMLPSVSVIVILSVFEEPLITPLFAEI